MAGVCKVRTTFKITGLGKDVSYDTGDVTMTVPVEHAGMPLYIIHSDAQSSSLQLSTIFPQYALAKFYGVFIIAEVGTIYIQIDTAGTSLILAADAHIVLNVGESVWLPINPAGNAGIAIDAKTATDAFSITAVIKV